MNNGYTDGDNASIGYTTYTSSDTTWCWDKYYYKIDDTYVVHNDIDDDYVKKSKYNALEKITLDLIRGGFRCNIKQAKKLLEEEIESYMKREVGDKFISKPKEWIEQDLFKV